MDLFKIDIQLNLIANAKLIRPFLAVTRFKSQKLPRSKK